MKKRKTRAAATLLLLAMLLSCLTGCGGNSSTAPTGDQVFDHGGSQTLHILSGSENKELGEILDAFSKQEHVKIVMDYAGSLDIMRTLESGADGYDAIWPASSLWLNVGDTGHVVKYAESISITPVVFGIRQSLAQKLGFVDREVSVSDILSAIQSGQLDFCMTSATQSNSGCSAYIGFLYALLGNPDVITSENLTDDALREQVSSLLSGVDRSSGSSDWLKDLYLVGNYNAMVNYECLVLSANQELEAQGRETLYTVYPYDGLSIADSPLGYVDHGNAKQEEAFAKLQDYLLSDKVQNEIQLTGRRTGYEGVSKENYDVFRSDWGLQPERVLSPFKMPATDVLMECLNLYQTEFRKPSLTVYCLDYSGSMAGDGRDQLVEAMAQLLIQKNAKENLLQASEKEVNIIIPFDSDPRPSYRSTGNGAELEGLYAQIEAEEVDGGTDIYSAAQQAMAELQNYDLAQYTPAVILMTDGQSGGNERQFEQAYAALGKDIPVFSIMFGDADSAQLDALAELTRARVFDGRENLVSAFRSVKGYN